MLTYVQNATINPIRCVEHISMVTATVQEILSMSDNERYELFVSTDPEKQNEIVSKISKRLSS